MYALHQNHSHGDAHMCVAQLNDLCFFAQVIYEYPNFGMALDAVGLDLKHRHFYITMHIGNTCVRDARMFCEMC